MNSQRIIEAAISVAKAKKAHLALNRLEDIQWAPDYAEPGYELGGKDGILFGNWNKLDRWTRETGSVLVEPDNTIWQKAVNLLGKVCDLEWSDEWTTCSDCGKAVRTQADSYQWQRSYVELDCEIVCCECVGKHAEDVLEKFEGNAKSALTGDLGLNPAAHGYWLAQDDFENGWYGGQDADPEAIARTLTKAGIERFLFRIDSVGQFDLKFSLFIHESEKEKWEKELEGTLSHSEYKAEEDPAVLLDRGLRAAAAAPRPKGDGIVVTKIHGGMAEHKLVSPEDFIAGKALD